MINSNSFAHLLSDSDSELFKIVSDSLDSHELDDGFYAVMSDQVVFDFLGVGFKNVEDARVVLGIPKRK
jgi:hypothetical protein